MTKKEALHILIQASRNDITGSGMGIRSTTEAWRQKVEHAIVRLFKDAYGRDMDSSDRYNLNIHYRVEERS